MSGENEINEELRDASNLRSLKGNVPFQAPDGYFEKFSVDVSDKSLQGKYLPQPFHAKKFILASSALICAIVIAAVLLVKQDTPPVVSNEISCTYDELLNSDYIEEIDENLLAEKLTSVSNDNTTDSAEDYLISNSDESLFTNEF